MRAFGLKGRSYRGWPGRDRGPSSRDRGQFFAVTLGPSDSQVGGERGGACVTIIPKMGGFVPPRQIGLGGNIFGVKYPKFCADGAVLEKNWQIFQILASKNVIKRGFHPF